MAEVASLRARIEAITQEQRTISPAAENSTFSRQLAFSLGGSTSPESSQTGMILVTNSNLGDSCQDSQTPLSTRNDLLNRVSSQDLDQDAASTDTPKMLKGVKYWKDVFDFKDDDMAWKAFRVTQRR